MREFKFRAWDNTEKKMWYNARAGGFKITCPSVYDERDGVLLYHWKDLENAKVMQWTGLKDKNKKPIYEGDIVKTELYCGCEYCSKTIELIKEVRFVNGRFIIEGIYEITKEDDYDLVYFGELALEVIGNIYENPELLK